ncbi:hypothetical protein KKD72_02460 [Patescibacteria group bacterium]|nr:hypothetical protein [Patescibacteria group bacterium]
MAIPKVVIVRTKKGRKYAEFIAKEINLAGYYPETTTIKDLKDYLEKNNCSPNKTIIHARTAHPGQIYRILKNLENQGYRVINSAKTIKLTSDKFASCAYAKERKIPCAETIKINKENATEQIKEKIKRWKEVVVKPITSRGQGEFCFKFNKNNIAELSKINQIPAKELVIQKFINYQRLSRIIVIAFKSLKKAVFYDEPGNDWKCSVCLNPEIKRYKNPPEDLLRFAEDIAKKFNGEISFIDIFTTQEGYILNEINTACSLAIHERISGYNISKEIADYLLNPNIKL